MKNFFQKVPNVITMIGLVLFFVGIFTTIPSDKLSSYDLSGYSEIEEYVGGDAYNYIIGASLVGGQIAGATIAKAVYISVGLLLMCMGALASYFIKLKAAQNRIKIYAKSTQTTDDAQFGA